MQLHHGCAKFQCVGARKKKWDLIEQGIFILCGFRRVTLSLWSRREREKETRKSHQ